MANATSEPDIDGQRLLERILGLWVEPDLIRRGMTGEDLATIERLTVVLPPGADPIVLLGAEADIEVLGPDDLHPVGVDPDAGWVCCARYGSQMLIGFDFRTYRGWGSRLIERAREYAEVARRSLAEGAVGPAIECGATAAELSVRTLMAVLGQEAPGGGRRRAKRHQTRHRWLQKWSELGNAPPDHARVLGALFSHRAAARYADQPLEVAAETVAEWLEVVDDMVREGRRAAGC